MSKSSVNEPDCYDTTSGKISVEKARGLIDEHTDNIGKESLPPDKARGTVLAESLVTKEPLPRFDQSAMDGYAVKTEDLVGASHESPVTLPCESAIAAGETDPVRLESGQTMRIYTGAPVPDSADAVVIQEKVERNGNRITFFEPANAGDNIRNKGEELEKGAHLLDEGTVLNTGALGLIWSQGYNKISVYKRPAVRVIATGDELVDPRNDPKPGQIRDTNSPMLSNLLQSMEIPVNVRRAEDNYQVLKDTFRDGIESFDLIIVAGGVSVGDRDYVKQVLSDLDVKRIFWKVNQKPGKPIYFGRRDSTYVLGLPGNPVSAMVCFYLYGIPLIRNLSGFDFYMSQLNSGLTQLLHEHEKKPGRTEFVRAQTSLGESGLESRIIPEQGSHMLSGLAKANSLLELPENKTLFEAGDQLRLNFLPESIIPRGDNHGYDPT